jgi:UDP-N-acetyl-D-mannosaminuronate dehydrogenase
VSYCDPYFPEARAGRKHDIGLQSVPLTAEEFARHDAVLLATAHREFADPALYRDTALVVDTRHVVLPGWGPEVVRA